MKVCQAGYCDFVVWRPTEIAVIRIIPNKSFIDSAINQATKVGVLPELIGKWYQNFQRFQVQTHLCRQQLTFLTKLYLQQMMMDAKNGATAEVRNMEQ